MSRNSKMAYKLAVARQIKKEGGRPMSLKSGRKKNRLPYNASLRAGILKTKGDQ